MDEVCGSDGITYSSVCRMLIESDDVYPMYDGPCNRTECQDAPVSNNNSTGRCSHCILLLICINCVPQLSKFCKYSQSRSTMYIVYKFTYSMLLQVCGTDFVTYPSICVLRSQTSNVRADYDGNLCIQAYSR